MKFFCNNKKQVKMFLRLKDKIQRDLKKEKAFRKGRNDQNQEALTAQKHCGMRPLGETKACYLVLGNLWGDILMLGTINIPEVTEVAHHIHSD